MADNPSTALLILGMHRSGTSMLARVLNLLGVNLGGNLMDAAEDNQKGFWEQEDVVTAHDQLLLKLGGLWHSSLPLPDNWMSAPACMETAANLDDILGRYFFEGDVPLWGVKDPRLSILMPLWEPLLQAHHATPVCVLALRHPLEVAGSLKARDGMAEAHSCGAWLHYTLMAEYTSRPYRRAVVSYGALLEDWRQATETLAKRLELSWPVSPKQAESQIEQFISKDLQHNEAESGNLSGYVKTVYALMQNAEKTGEVDTKALDEIHEAWLAECRPYGPCLHMGVADLQALRLQAEGEAKDLSRQCDELLAKYEDAEHRAQASKQHNIELEQTLDDTEAELGRMQRSLSWKLTHPLRLLRRAGTSADTE